MFSLSDYAALVDGQARVPAVDRGVLRLTGADAASWLQGLVTCDVLTLQPGRRQYGALLTPQGRMITDLWVVPAPDGLWLDVPAPLAASLAARLDALIFAEDVKIDDASAEVACEQLVGVAWPPAAATSPSAAGLVVADHTYGRESPAYGDLGAAVGRTGDRGRATGTRRGASRPSRCSASRPASPASWRT
ncbi:MAG: hypothetical protein R2712_14185 [Vicinamibacterales bacterium]